MNIFEKTSLGRYKGKTLPWIIFRDPDYFFWTVENNIWSFSSTLKDNARFLNAASQSINIPDNEDRSKCVIYYDYVDGSTRKFESFEIVDKKILDVPYYNPKWSTVIDLKYPRTLMHYDKLGNRLMIKSLKFRYFGSTSFRMTEKRCQDFFTNQDNFNIEIMEQVF